MEGNVVVKFLNSKFGVPIVGASDERDHNIQLPSEPRRHDKVFEIYDALKRRGKAPQ
jgi:hypothetical protein